VSLPRLYLVTDRHACPGDDLVDRVTAALAALPDGAALVQLREKDLDTRALLALARRLLAVTRPCGARLLINERVDVALAACADGIHLPADGIGLERARALAGPDLVLGASTHAPDQAAAAARAGADLIVIGPVWSTPSKPGAAPLGIEGLAAAAAAVAATGAATRVYALGGVDTPERARAAIAAGAHGIAAIRGFLAADDPGAAAAALHAAVAAT